MTISVGKQAIYLGAKTLTEEKNYTRIKQGAEKLGVSLSKRLVTTFPEWKKAFEEAQKQDFLVMGSNSGIEGWNDENANLFAESKSTIVSVTNHQWMMGVSLLGFTKVAREHGEWAAEAALAILKGTAVSDIPIVTNRKWDLWINDVIADSAAIELPPNFTLKAKKVASSK